MDSQTDLEPEQFSCDDTIERFPFGVISDLTSSLHEKLWSRLCQRVRETNRVISSFGGIGLQPINWLSLRERSSSPYHSAVIALKPLTFPRQASRLGREEVNFWRKDSVGSVTGIAPLLMNLIHDDAKPICPSCHLVGIRNNLEGKEIPKKFKTFALTTKADDSTAKHLPREIAEYFGSKYAIVNSILVEVDRLEGSVEVDGVVLVTMNSSSIESVMRESKRLGNLTGTLELWGFSDREAKGELLGKINSIPRCPNCEKQLPNIKWSSDQIADLNHWCERCRGDGFTSQVGTPIRYMKCEECRGTGLNEISRSFSVEQVNFADLATIRIRDLSDLVERSLNLRFSTAIGEATSVLERLGFGDRSVVEPISHWSSTERLKINCALIAMRKITRATFVLDNDWNVKGLRDALELLAEKGNRVLIRSEQVDPDPQLKSSEAAKTDQFVILKDLDFASLEIKSIKFPINALSLVVGPPNCGKSILLRDFLARRFQTRKGDHLISEYLDIQKIQLIDGQKLDENLNGEFSADLLQISDEICDFISQLPLSRSLGFTAKDFHPLQSRFRCQVCNGIGWNIKSRGDCSSCLGKRFDPTISEISAGGIKVGDLWNLTLESSSKLPWISNSGLWTLRWSIQRELGKIKLGETVDFFDIDTQRFIAAIGHLKTLDSRSKSGRKRSNIRLILLDGTFSRLREFSRAVFLEAIQSCIEEGSTVISAECDSGILPWFNNLINLETDQVKIETRDVMYLDKFLGHRTEIVT